MINMLPSTIASKKEAVTLSPRKVYVNPVSDVLLPLKERYSRLIVRRAQSVEIVAGQPDMLVWADPSLLHRTCDNLLSNAIKYGQPGSRILITVSERGLVDEISVWNSGPGIATHDLEKIFDPESDQLRASTPASQSVDLAACRQFIEAHGGHLWAESRPGSWANFILTLPKRRV